MLRRKFGTAIFGVLTLLFVGPVIVGTLIFSIMFIQSSGRIAIGILALDGGIWCHTHLANATFVNDQFYWGGAWGNAQSGRVTATIGSIDPETGEGLNQQPQTLDVPFVNPPGPITGRINISYAGDTNQFWMVDDSGRAYERRGFQFNERTPTPSQVIVADFSRTTPKHLNTFILYGN